MDHHTPPQRRSPTRDPASTDAAIASATRLAAVHRSGLLDSPAEESFDSLTQLAARLVKTPASFIAVVDGSRDFYKSQVGFPIPLAVARQMEGRTFCHYTLTRDDPLVIEDTHSDPVWKAVPTVESLGVRSYVGVPLKVDGENVGSFCVIDMKPRVWTADELETVRQLAVSAERELGLRAALTAAEESALASIALARAREEVVAVVAHDLRTPLQILQLGTLKLQRSPAGAEQAATTTRMLAAVEVMAKMADGLLSADAVSKPSPAGRQSLPAATLAADAVDMMGPIAERSSIALTLGAVAQARIAIDYAQMLRVLGNLIGNALKYSPAGSTISVSGSRDGALLSLVVADNGRGMDEAEQARAFERGWQGGEGMKRGDGAGLGLAIVRTLVEQHGGRVGLTSALGRGTAVTISLPCH
ncbi:MAG: GAF domain-containing sensor histidine kinase [Pseudomonadota bacterium]